MIRANTRVPDEVIGDFHAMMAANDTGATAVVQLMEEGELTDLTEFGRFVQGRSETSMRAAIRGIPNGVYRSPSFSLAPPRVGFDYDRGSTRAPVIPR